MAPAEPQRPLPAQSQLGRTPLEAPRPFLQLVPCLQGFGGAGRGVSVSKPSIRISIVDRRYPSA